MNYLAKVIFTIVVSSAVILPTIASRYGWGLSTEKNRSLMREAAMRQCKSGRRDQYGNCRRSYRNNYYSRSYRGGSRGYGK